MVRKGIGVLVAVALASVGILLLAPWGYAPYHEPPPPQEEGAVEILIRVGSFFFEGPEGRSDSADEPVVVARLTNGETVKLIFENVSSAVHQVVSPLLSAPEEKVFTIRPGERLEFELTPRFLTVEDGFPLEFDLSCHVGHGSSADHFKQGMHALIEIVPKA